MGKSKYSNYVKSLTIISGALSNVQGYRQYCYSEDKEIALNEHLGIVDNRSIGVRWYNYSHIGIKEDTLKDCAIRLLHSKGQKVYRCNKKIVDIIKNNINPVFITLTFTDDILKSTTQETRRRYVSRFLKENCSQYVANIDYSPDLGREHYHAVIDCPVSFDNWLDKGFVFAERIRKHTTPKKLSNYINKLVVHAFKVKNMPRLIYSRQ